LSLKIIPHSTTSAYGKYISNRNEHFTALIINDQIIWSKSNTHSGLEQQLLHQFIVLKFLFCVREEVRKSFSFFFWTTPFDEITWVFLFSTIIFIYLSLAFKSDCISLFGILMRQSVNGLILRKHKVLLLFILVTIVITCCYESIISGFLTVPPPVIFFQTLKELVDNGYSLWGTSRSDRKILAKIFETENITSRTLDSVILDARYRANNKKFGGENCNTTKAVPESLMKEKIFEFVIRKLYSDEFRCHLTPDSSFRRVNLFTFLGYGK